mgnify:CR=1 FL=1
MWRGQMVDIHHKSPSQQRKRWWTIPIPTKAYKDGWDRIFKKKEPLPTDEEIEEARHALDLAEHNDSIGMAPIIKMRRDEYHRLLELRDGE